MEDNEKEKAAPSHLPPDPVALRRQQANRQANAVKRYEAQHVHHLEFKANQPVKPYRSAAQLAASRRNGAKSRGPNTPEGKARSSTDSLKHGLLARLLAPPGDARNHDQMYHRIRTQLIAEFKPSTFTERAAVDKLAKLYLQSARAEAMIESLHCPRGIKEKVANDYQEFKLVRRSVKHLSSLICQLDDDGRLSCTGDVAALVANVVAEHVETMRDDLLEETVPFSEMDEEERKEDVALREAWEKVRPVNRLLLDRKQLAQVLSGELKIMPGAKIHLRYVLNNLLESRREWIEKHADREKAMTHANEQWVMSLANEPQRLMLLQRYANEFDRLIERQLAQLDPLR